MPVRIGRSGLAHEDQDRTARISGTGGIPLAAVDEVVVAVAHDGTGDVSSVGRSDVRLGHGEGRADLAGEQGLQPPLLLRFGAVTQNSFHVAGVRRAAVEHLGREMRAPHDLAQGRVF